MSLKHTALYAQHIAQHARMVDFAGWEMPLHYGSQLEEHMAVRQHAGIFDVSHMNIVDISGPQAQHFLRVLLAHDVAKLMPGQALYSCMLNTQGGIIDDLIVYYLAPETYRLILNAGRYNQDMVWLQQQAVSFEVAIFPHQQLSIIALQGPHAEDIADSVFSGQVGAQLAQLKPFQFLLHDPMMIARTGYTGEDGFEIILPHSHAPALWQRLQGAGAHVAGLGARDSLRLEAGFLLYGNDMDETTTPLESNLDWTISWQPENRDFIGRTALLTQKQQGIAHSFVGLSLEKGGILRHGQSVWHKGQQIGKITSGGFSPVLNSSIALARIQRGNFELVNVEIRDKQLPVRITKPFFVRHGKLIQQI